MEPIDDDVFEYTTGGMSQCISGFGKNAVEAVDEKICEHMSRPERDEVLESLEWHVGELVRWCQGLNHRAQEATRLLELHREFHKAVACPGVPECAVCVAEDAAKAVEPV